ncbi:MAG: DUF4301 family protein [Bacteroidales bacterium]|jgi:hypothetical protein|nr:DUF4301 family protein [Bacteroidales bacterium]
MLTPAQILEIQNKEIAIEQVEKQLQRFTTGFPPMKITAPAILGNGILHFDEKEAAKYAKLYDKKKKYKSIVKFVPASGAATRMFKMLFTILETYDGSQESYDALFTKKGLHTPLGFIENLHKFAFYPQLCTLLSNAGLNIDELLAKKDYKPIVEYIVTPKGLNYGNLPKGLLLFHSYGNTSRTAVEEHLVEGALYAKQHNNDVNIHFTVSPEFMQGFKDCVNNTKNAYQTQYNVKYYNNYSIQKPTTDTIAVNLDNSPFENADGSLLFRPAGHGALIENLNDLDFDLIFIKNIDNVVPDSHKETTVLYKKVLAGILIDYQNTLYKYFSKISKSRHLSDKRFRAVTRFLSEELFFHFPEGFETWARNDCKDYILEILNRPIRVCGMVKNEGEPGGGPFFVQENDGAQTLQIIEKAQIDSANKQQMAILNASTHFNPVDLVCGIKNCEGKKYNLLDFIDEDSGIITTKSSNGKELKALELPGLWNGAMSNWNTIFVEIPIETFNPVKEVTDLLRSEHLQA